MKLMFFYAAVVDLDPSSSRLSLSSSLTPRPSLLLYTASRPSSTRRQRAIVVKTRAAADGLDPSATPPQTPPPPPPPRPPPTSRTRLATTILTVPRRVDLYFAGKPIRRALWTAISFGVGFYAANTVSLSFGALAINDVIAAALSVAGYEVASALVYASPGATRSLRLRLLNAFKIGAACAFIMDAFKLAGYEMSLVGWWY